jgi:hypothetical protein
MPVTFFIFCGSLDCFIMNVLHAKPKPNDVASAKIMKVVLFILSECLFPVVPSFTLTSINTRQSFKILRRSISLLLTHFSSHISRFSSDRFKGLRPLEGSDLSPVPRPLSLPKYSLPILLKQISIPEWPALQLNSSFIPLFCFEG